MPWDYLVMFAVMASVAFAYFLLVPDPRKIYPELGEMLRGASYEAQDGLFDDGRSALSGQFAHRPFRIIAIPGGGRGGANAQTIVRLGYHAAAAEPNSVVHSRPLEGTLPGTSRSSLPSRSDPFGALNLPVGRQSGPQRSVEDLWDDFGFNSRGLRRRFAKGRLFIGEGEVIWACYGIYSSAETLNAILTFLACIATEVEKHSATWVQTRKAIRIQDYGQFIFYAVMLFMLFSFAVTFALLAGR